MAITDSQWQAMIVREVGDNDEHELADNIELIWQMNALYAVAGTNLWYLYAKRQAISFMMGDERTNVTFTSDDQMTKLSDRFTFLEDMYKLVEAEIEKVQKLRQGSFKPATGTINTTAPISPADDARTVGAPDANDRAYRGDAYLRSTSSVYRRSGGWGV